MFLCLGALLNIFEFISTQPGEKQNPQFQFVPFMVYLPNNALSLLSTVTLPF